MSNAAKHYYKEKLIVVVHEAEFDEYVLAYYKADKKKSKFKINKSEITNK